MAAKPRKQLSIAECDALFIRPGTLFEMSPEIVNGREYRVWKNGWRMVRPYLVDRMNKWASRVFINACRDEPYPKDERFDYTFGEIHRRALQVAGWLRETHGVGVGTRVGVLGFNSVEWAVVWVALHLLGAVPAIINSWVQPDALVHCLTLSKPVLVLADAKSADAVAPYSAELKAGGVGPILAWSTMEHLTYKDHPVVDLWAVPVSKEAVLAVTTGDGLESLTPQSLGSIFFTSGTTGLPKGVPMTQQGLLHNLKCGQSMVIRAALRAGAPLDMALSLVVTENTEQSRALHAVPMFHVTGCGQFLNSFNDGKKMHFMRRWSATDAVELLIKYKINQVSGVPAISNAILQHPGLPDDHQLTAVMYGGAAPPERLGADMKNRWPELILNHAWGMTECQGLITSFVGPDYLERPKSCGPPIPSNDVRVVDIETRRVLGPNEVGSLEVRGYNVLSGYLDDPVATAKAIDKDGWFDSGDVGCIDKDGFVYISDRIKDIIIRGGENIASEEVENAIYLDDRIAEAASVPVPDDMLGELVAVGVSLKPGVKATPEEIIAAATPRLRREARPVFVWVSEDVLPMNANGKYLKSEIKKTVQALYKQHKAREAKL
ncbi:hypothetical protein CspHIS471_0206430 [Cutaneotrichosporon sp. HIS471]|nr:hypothetical protein CspHIS471_0206430 [Cutaneotrichosporon sp. HIS471]